MHFKNPEKNNDLTLMKDHDLLTRFSMVVQKEREAIVTVVSYLSEIERRKLYLEEAYSSLFSFVTRKFHYSEGAAYRRIQASKVSEFYPEVLGLLSEGKVSLMTLSLIEPHLTREKGKEWIEKIIGKSKREVEFMLSELSLKKENHRDIIRRLPVFREEGLKESEDNRSEEEKRGSDLRQEKLPAPDKGGEQFLLPSAGSETEQSHAIGEDSSEKSGSFTNGTGGERNGTSTGESSRGFTSESDGGRDGRTFTSETSVESAQKISPQMKEGVRKIKIEFVAKEELAQKIERAKEILRHKFPEGRFEDIFNQALEDMLEKRDPQRKPQAVSLRSNERAEKKSEKASEHGEKMKREDKNNGTKEAGGEKELAPFSRHIPEHVRRKVFERDGGECSYESPDGRRCGERNFLHIDHVQPFALGGESTKENLRLLCAQHNRWRSEKTFGKWG